MALAWVLRQPAVTTVVIGASKVSQIEDAIGTLQNLSFSDAELKKIDTILS
jgi:L-glyceraldehyde 3-phosphate reductase